MGLSQIGGKGSVVGRWARGDRALVCLGEASSMSKSLNYIKVDLRVEKTVRGRKLPKISLSPSPDLLCSGLLHSHVASPHSRGDKRVPSITTLACSQLRHWAGDKLISLLLVSPFKTPGDLVAVWPVQATVPPKDSQELVPIAGEMLGQQ